MTEGATSHLSRPDWPYNVVTAEGNPLTDKRLNTGIGQGVINTCRYVWIDLKEAKWVDKVTFVVSDDKMRTKGVKFWLGDTLPLPGADTTDWLYLGETEVAARTADLPEAYNEFVLTEEQADQWRYVIADFTGQDVGGYVQEIHAYERVYIPEP